MSKDKQTSGFSCYDCEHLNVCKYANRLFEERFPFKSDSIIEKYLTCITCIYAYSCSHYERGKK